MYFLGNMSIGAGASVNNTTTAVPFAIPIGLDSVLVLASATGLLATLKPDPVTPSTLAAASSSVPIGATLFQIPCPSTPSASPVLALWNTTVGTLTAQLWAVYS